MSGPVAVLEWHPDDQLQLFPQEVARSMLAHGWANPPTEAAVKWYEDREEVKTGPTNPKPKQKPLEPPEPAKPWEK